MKVPDLVQNVYRDLRDRRMLSIAIALVAAIIAVPFLASAGGGGDSGSTATSTAAPTAPFVGDEQLDPVVLAEVPGLRDFRERLAGYQSRNPFKSQAPDTGGGGNGNGGNGNGLGTGAGAGTGSGSGTDTDGSDVPSIDIPSGGGSDTGTSGTSGTGTDPGTSGTDPGTGTGTDGAGGGSSGSQLITYRIDVRVGPVGDTKVLEGVKSFSFLPDSKHPLVQYVDADTGGHQVAMIVNPTAAAIKGKANCVPKLEQCQYLVMKPGEDMEFLFDDQRYSIELKAINEHRQPYEPQSQSGDDGDGDGGSGGGSSQRDISAMLGY